MIAGVVVSKVMHSAEGGKRAGDSKQSMLSPDQGLLFASISK